MLPQVFHGSSNSRTSFVLAISERLRLGKVGFMVAADVAGWIVGVLDRTFACILVESSVGAVAVSVDLFICDFVNTVVDEASCESFGIFVDLDVELIFELLIMVVEVVSSKEGLSRGLEEAVDVTRCFEEAVDVTRRKTPTKTIRGDIFCLSLC